MKSEVLNAMLLFSSMMVYMEWSNRYCFAIQAEAEVLCRLLHATKSVMPPLTLLPIIGHLFLFFYVFIAGVLSLNLKQTVSTFPFFLLSVLIIRRFRRQAQGLSSAPYEAE